MFCIFVVFYCFLFVVLFSIFNVLFCDFLLLTVFCFGFECFDLNLSCKYISLSHFKVHTSTVEPTLVADNKLIDYGQVLSIYLSTVVYLSTKRGRLKKRCSDFVHFSLAHSLRNHWRISQIFTPC